MYTNIETERLRIRPITLNDADFIFHLVNSAGWIKFIGDRKVHSQKDAEDYIQKILEGDHSFYHVFEEKETYRAMGILTLLKRQDEKYPDIGFAILPEVEKKGYTFEAASAYLQQLQKSGNFQQIIAFTTPSNSQSISLLKRLGLTHAGDKKRGNDMLSYFRLVK